MRFNYLKRTLMARGYWAPADDGSGGGGGDADAAVKAEAARVLAAEEATRAEHTAEAARLAALGGKSKPTDAEAKLLREVMDRKEKQKEAEAALEAARTALKEFEGLDAKELRTLLQNKKDAETAALEAKGAWDSLKSQMLEQHTKELATANEGKSAAEQRAVELVSQIGELTVGNSFGQSKFIAEQLTLSVAKARRVYGAHFEFKDGAVVAFDKPAGQKDRNVLVDGKGDPLTFEAAITKLVDLDPDKDTLLKSKLKTGANSGTTATTLTRANPNSREQTSGRSKISAGLKTSGLK
jgi:hypothetical protein